MWTPRKFFGGSDAAAPLYRARIDIRFGSLDFYYVKYFTKFLHGKKSHDNIRAFKVSFD